MLPGLLCGVLRIKPRALCARLALYQLNHIPTHYFIMLGMKASQAVNQLSFSPQPLILLSNKIILLYRLEVVYFIKLFQKQAVVNLQITWNKENLVQEVLLSFQDRVSLL